MIYTLKHFDTPLIRFSADSGAEANVKVIWTDESKRELFPLDLEEVSEKGVDSWVRHRSIPKNRAYVNTLLSAMGLSINRPYDIIRVSRGLSLNDCYWVTEEGFNGSFDKYNLYDNRFNSILGQIAFTGYGSNSVTGLTSSPEFTTNGMLPKCWRHIDHKTLLYKGGTQGASNTGFEPYSEYYAYQIAQILGINAIEYGLSKWKSRLCSTCELFTSKEMSFVPVGRIVRSGGLKAVRDFYRELGKEYERALDDMIVFDAVILNTDRHYGNFGFLVNSRTNKIAAPAPLFDHGNSLLNYAAKDVLTDVKSIRKYADTLLPRVYDDFISEAKPLLTHEHRNGLRKLLNFHFKRHSRYNLPKERLALVESVVREQARNLLDNG